MLRGGTSARSPRHCTAASSFTTAHHRAPAQPPTIQQPVRCVLNSQRHRQFTLGSDVFADSFPALVSSTWAASVLCSSHVNDFSSPLPSTRGRAPVNNNLLRHRRINSSHHQPGFSRSPQRHDARDWRPGPVVRPPCRWGLRGRQLAGATISAASPTVFTHGEPVAGTLTNSSRCSSASGTSAPRRDRRRAGAAWAADVAPISTPAWRHGVLYTERCRSQPRFPAGRTVVAASTTQTTSPCGQRPDRDGDAAAPEPADHRNLVASRGRQCRATATSTAR